MIRNSSKLIPKNRNLRFLWTYVLIYLLLWILSTFWIHGRSLFSQKKALNGLMNRMKFEIIYSKIDKDRRLFTEKNTLGYENYTGSLIIRQRSRSELISPIYAEKSAKATVAFVTYELYPVTMWGGGAGVVINGLIIDLLKEGHDVIVVGDMGAGALENWKKHRDFSKHPGKVFVVNAPGIVRRGMIKSSSSIFLTKGRMFAKALELIYKEHPFDIVETFDYTGIAYELLRKKSPHETEYLPESVSIAVRMHGTLQLIDKAENVEVESYPPSERNIMYLQENYCVRAADILLVQTQFTIESLAKHYKVLPDDFTNGPAPINSILSYVDEAYIANTEEETWNETKDRLIIVYGRFQLVKGLKTIIAASVEALKRTKRLDRNMKVMFVGPDVFLTDRLQFTSSYLASLVPPEFQGHFIFSPKPIDRKKMVSLTKKAFAAIFASEFESLNLAVHEIARCKVPLILSEIPAFKQFFAESDQAWFFPVGNDKHLANILEEVVLKNQYASRINEIRMGKTLLKYPDSTKPYKLHTWKDSRRRYLPDLLALQSRITYSDYLI